jgi:intracellular septation protein A
MNTLLGFAPYIAFYVAISFVTVEATLCIAAAVALLVAGWNWARSGSLKVLEIGSVVVFAALAALTAAFHWPWTLIAVRLAVDSGLLAVVLFSLAIDRPFTLQYARERAPPEVWNTPLFMSVNRRITWVWAAAFAAMVAAHATVVFVPGTPSWIDTAVTIAALLGAFRFTARYPDTARRKAAIAAGG